MKLRLQPHHAPRFATLQARGDVTLTALPLGGYRQARPYTCGFATSLMVLRYFGATVPGQVLFQRLGTSRDGTRQSAIVRELRGAGLRANTRRDVDFARICREIDRNKLIIGYLGDSEHWLVIYGYGRDPERVLVADPTPDESCERLWQSFGHRLSGFGIVCSHPHDSSALRQPLLGLGKAVQPSGESPLALPPPAPLPQLRCEVRALRVGSAPEPTQLVFSFG